MTYKIIVPLAVILLMSACSDGEQNSKAEGPAAAVETRTYQAVGVVKGIDPKSPIIEVDHEDIPGLMPAMQMKFHVKDRLLMEGLVNGDRIGFTVENGVGGLKIIAIQKR